MLQPIIIKFSISRMVTSQRLHKLGFFEALQVLTDLRSFGRQIRSCDHILNQGLYWAFFHIKNCLPLSLRFHPNCLPLSLGFHPKSHLDLMDLCFCFGFGHIFKRIRKYGNPRGPLDGQCFHYCCYALHIRPSRPIFFCITNLLYLDSSMMNSLK